MNHVLNRIAKEQKGKQAEEELWEARADAIYHSCNKKQKGLLEDKNKVISLRCPRRSGKTHGLCSKALEYGERHAGSRILIISLNIGFTKQNYWSGAPAGLHEMSKRFHLNLKFNGTDLTWEHENGSRGRISGCETRADIEKFRGSTVECDIIIIDECYSFSNGLLQDLLDNAIMPGLATRDGTLIMGGTPGSVPYGPFFEATSLDSRKKDPQDPDGDGYPTCVMWEPGLVTDLWSLHTWTVQDNNSTELLRGQWKRFLKNKERNGWTDDSPIWRREYLGQWVTDISEAVYSYAKYKYEPNSRVHWTPCYQENNLGLISQEGPWHLIMGLDFGLEDADAIVLAAYSDTLQELREVFCWKENHIDIDVLLEKILDVIKTYGEPEIIIGDCGALGKKIVLTLNNRKGLSIIPADKTRKAEYIEMMNSDMGAGRVKILAESELADEMTTLQWYLTKEKTILIREGKLKEDPKCPNHLCDAFLYLWRYAYHYWAKIPEKSLDKGTPEWYKEQEKVAKEKYKSRLRAELNEVDNFDRLFKQLKRNDDFPRY